MTSELTLGWGWSVTGPDSDSVVVVSSTVVVVASGG